MVSYLEETHGTPVEKHCSILLLLFSKCLPLFFFVDVFTHFQSFISFFVSQWSILDSLSLGHIFFFALLSHSLISLILIIFLSLSLCISLLLPLIIIFSLTLSICYINTFFYFRLFLFFSLLIYFFILAFCL